MTTTNMSTTLHQSEPYPPSPDAAARAKARRDRQKALGLCISCSVPALAGLTRCRRHLSYFARDQKARRDAAKGTVAA